ncbi:SHOCT domain-containing protein [uncultured Vagococcus sp.]|uniref:SHOCT domain-containing protein n=1 Tax=uncultured Vagococcus sp. TaxID=189676 RepID=UPI0028D055F0|nr:SHOCT domain-containing protein [uncultured Vagococcus sp.]
MGLFTKKENKPDKSRYCEYCGDKITFMKSGPILSDKFEICGNCANRISVGKSETLIHPKTLTLKMATDLLKQVDAFEEIFSPSATSPKIEVDFNNQLIRFGFGSTVTYRYLTFDNFLSYEHIEETTTHIVEADSKTNINPKTNQKIEKLIKNISLKINTNIPSTPYFFVVFYSSFTPKHTTESYLYDKQMKNIRQGKALLDSVLRHEPKSDSSPVQPSTVSESSEEKVVSAPSNIQLLRDYKSLLDDGIITQEEFDQKKKELL